ncbi:MAG TPA: histidine kinase [Gaiellaceae bacterium]|nr:histidine kinase [Gaiellaceae bacterium]
MPRARAPAVAATLAAAVGLAVVTASAALVGGAGEASYGGVVTAFAVLEMVAGAALLAAAVALIATGRGTASGVLAVAASAAWFAPNAVGWEDGSSLARGAGLLFAPLLPALVFALAASIPPALAGRPGARLLGLVTLLTAATAAASIGLALVRDPLRDRYCWRDCTLDALVVHDDVVLARRLAWLVLGLAVTGGLLATLTGTVRLARAAAVTRRGSGPALAAAALTGLALSAYALALVLEPREEPGRALYGWLFVARSLALVALAAALAWIAVRPVLVRGRVTRLAVDLERSAAEGGLGRLLARALGDPGLRLGYPIGAGDRVVDADGRPLALDRRRVTPLLGDDGVVALVESDVTTADVVESELGPASQLALGNERLRAEALVRLSDVIASRARIVNTADTARRRMERDLHDGAQQRLLALTYDLRAALTIAESSGNPEAVRPLREALDRAVVAAQDLRDIAHGIFPAELTASGLESALESLADVRPLRLTVGLPTGRRYDAELEAAAYAVVADSAEDGGLVVVTIAESDVALLVAVEGDVDWGERRLRVDDRVGAVGGHVSASGRRLEALFPLRPPPG